MNRFKKIFLASFLLLQVFSYLHLAEHGEGGKHEQESSCDIVCNLNNFSADDSINVVIQLPELEKSFNGINKVESQISQLIPENYFSRAPPQIS
jgi:hypothetical protein